MYIYIYMVFSCTLLLQANLIYFCTNNVFRMFSWVASVSCYRLLRQQQSQVQVPLVQYRVSNCTLLVPANLVFSHGIVNRYMIYYTICIEFATVSYSIVWYRGTHVQAPLIQSIKLYTAGANLVTAGSVLPRYSLWCIIPFVQYLLQYHIVQYVTGVHTYRYSQYRVSKYPLLVPANLATAGTGALPRDPRPCWSQHSHWPLSLSLAV